MVPELRTLMKEVNKKIDDINCGGCCVAAAIIAEHLRTKNIPVKIVVLNDWGSSRSLTKIRKERQKANGNKQLLTNGEWCRGGVSFDHVVVIMTWYGRQYVIDVESGCVIKKKYLQDMGYKITSGQFTQKEAEYLANSSDGWNPWFDRGQIPRMYKIIKQGMESIYR